MRVGVLGAGLMAKRIGLLFAHSNYEVLMWNRAENDIQAGLKREARLWRVDFERIRDHLRFTTDLSDVAGCNFVVESIIEDAEIKKKLLRQVSSDAPDHTIIVSNTSSLSLTDLAKDVRGTYRFAGLHFFNPPQNIKFAEITKLESTVAGTLEIIASVLGDLGFSYIVIPDIPGFVVNNLLFSMINSAILMVEATGLEPRIVDDAMKLGARHPMGPLELADFIGLDVSLNILSNLYERTADSRFRPGKLLQDLVASHELGRKTKKGFYQYR